MIKRLSLALVTLGLSASAYAAHPVDDMLPAAPPTVAVTIPQQTGSWAIGIEALYQSPSNGDLHYATTATNSTNTAGNVTTTDLTAKVHSVDVGHDWGWQIDLAYLFPGNGRDVELAWKHLHTDDSSSRDRASGTLLLGPSIFSPVFVAPAIFPVNTFDNGWDTARGNSDYDYDHVDLMFGQKMDFGQKVTVRMAGGLRYAKIDFKDRGRYFASEAAVLAADPADTVDLVATTKSEFQGLGPRGTIDAKVRLGGSFSIVGTMGGSLLVGDLDQSANANFSAYDGANDLITAANASSKVSDETHVVPELDARVGVNFAWAFNPDAALEIELGYEAINYFDVKDTALTSYADVIGHENDFAIRGPYLRFQLNLA